MTTTELLARTELDVLATTLVGDGKAPNWLFVSISSRENPEQSQVVTMTQDPRMAYNQWKRLVRESKGLQPLLEDRVHGTVASVEPDEQDRLCVYDDFRQWFPNE